MRKLQIWDEGKFDQISASSPIASLFPTGLLILHWESGEQVAEGQPSLSNGKIANSQLFSHPPIWFSLLSVPNKCTIGKFSGYWLWTYIQRWVSDQKDLWLRPQTQLESLFPILQAWSTSQLFFLNVFALQYKSWANIFKRFICLGFSWRYPGRNSLPSRRDFHRLNNNRVNNHHNHYHNNNDHHHDGEAHRRPVLHPLRPQGRARGLHAGREEVWGEAQGSGLQGNIPLGNFSCSDYVWLGVTF